MYSTAPVITAPNLAASPPLCSACFVLLPSWASNWYHWTWVCTSRHAWCLWSSRLYLSLCWSCCFDPLFSATRFPQHSTSPHVLWSRLTSPAVVTSISLFPPLRARQSVSHPPRPLCQMFHAIYIFLAFLPLSLSLNYLVPQTNFSLIFFLFSFFSFFVLCGWKIESGWQQTEEGGVSVSFTFSLSLSPYSFA